MKPVSTDTPKERRAAHSDWSNEFLAEAELLAKVRTVSQQIVDRVNKLLGDTATHESLLTEG